MDAASSPFSSCTPSGERPSPVPVPVWGPLQAGASSSHGLFALLCQWVSAAYLNRCRQSERHPVRGGRSPLFLRQKVALLVLITEEESSAGSEVALRQKLLGGIPCSQCPGSCRGPESVLGGEQWCGPEETLTLQSPSHYLLREGPTQGVKTS